ncbi:hypothetical protein ACSBR1_027537 [Camellia fascicularis]
MPPQSSGIADYAGNSTTRKAKKPGPTKTTANNTMSRIEMKATTNPKGDNRWVLVRLEERIYRKLWSTMVAKSYLLRVVDHFI